MGFFPNVKSLPPTKDRLQEDKQTRNVQITITIIKSKYGLKG